MTDQILQLTTWFLTLVECILGLYILVLNPWHTANRHTGGLLLLIAAITFPVGAIALATTPANAGIAPIILAITIPMIQPAVLICSIVLLKPEWTKQKPWLNWLIYSLLLLPLALTTFDLLTTHTVSPSPGVNPSPLGAPLWYTGLNPRAYTGGYQNLSEFTAGLLGAPLRIVTLSLTGLLTVVFLLAILLTGLWRRGKPDAVRRADAAGRSADVAGRSADVATRSMAALLLLTQAISFIISFTPANLLSTVAKVILMGALFAVIYAYAGFQQMLSERRLQRGSLQLRLTSLLLVVTLPILVAVTVWVTATARQQFERLAYENLAATNTSLSGAVSIWLDANTQALQELASRPEILSLDPALQKPALERMAAAHPHMYLVSTTDLTGLNLARSDAETPKDYSNRRWFNAARNGVPLSFQTVTGLTSGQPALVVSVPLLAADGQVTGVAMFAADLDTITEQVKRGSVPPLAGRLGSESLSQQTIAYIVDNTNLLVSHPDPALTAELHDLSAYPPVVALRQGQTGNISFSEPTPDPAAPSLGPAGQQWTAHINRLDNGWAVIVQQPITALQAPINRFQNLAWLTLTVGVAILLILSALTIRQAVLPIKGLTETAAAITLGDLDRVARVESDDEIGILARAFNAMTNQLRDLIAGLEQRVATRTRDLQRRLVQLQVTAEVAREANSLRELEPLLNHTARLISERLSFYHTGIFLLDENRAAAVLRAASSPGGQRMLARGHQLKVGQEGIVGYVAAAKEPRIALDVGRDAVFFDNPDLPETRSEVALPLIARDQVIGVIDVQSIQESAFSSEDIEILQILADQVALAIDNTRLLAESQAAVKELQSLYGRYIQQSWHERATRGFQAYELTEKGVRPATASPVEPLSENGAGPIETLGLSSVETPIELRGQRLGIMRLNRPASLGPWMPEEKDLINNVTSQVALALENARLLEEVRNRAHQEQLISRIAARAQTSLDLDAIMKLTVQEIGRALNVTQVRVRLSPGDDPDLSGGNGDNGERMPQ